jgi:hypothetical protein
VRSTAAHNDPTKSDVIVQIETSNRSWKPNELAKQHPVTAAIAAPTAKMFARRIVRTFRNPTGSTSKR